MNRLHSMALLLVSLFFFTACGTSDVSSIAAPIGGAEAAAALADGLQPTEGHPGWTAVEAAVTDGGQARTRVPIVVPPGRAGRQPQLSFEYESGAMDGLMGPGWALAGLSAITVCESTIAIDASENRRVFDGKPAFCLDGQRLVPTECVSGSCDGAFEQGEYRLANSADVRVHLDGDEGAADSTFTVYTRSGLVRRYGGPDAIVSGPVHVDNGDGEAVLSGDVVVSAWLLERETDRSQNALVVEYTRTDYADGAVEVLPDVIRYADHPALGPGARSVKFLYAARSPRTTYRSGMASRNSQVLTGIETFAPAVSGPVRTYTLSYEQSESTQRPLLSSLVECDFAGVCRSPIEFEYTERDPVAFGAATGVPLLAREHQAHGVVDVDGDGRHAFMVDDQFARWVDGAFVVEALTDPFDAPRFAADANGDGRTDLLYPGGTRLLVAELSPVFDGLHGIRSYDLETIDVVRPMCTTFTAHFGNFDGSIPGQETQARCGDAARAVLDLDGDGIHEVVPFYEPLLPGEPPEETIGFLLEAESFRMQRHYADLNGDGLADVLGLMDPTRPLLWINTGNGFLPPVDFPIDFGAVETGSYGDYVFALSNAWLTRNDAMPEDVANLLPHRQQDVRIVDLNQDGLADFVAMFAAQRVPSDTSSYAYQRRGSLFALLNRGDHLEAHLVGPSDGFYEMGGDPDTWGAPRFVSALPDLDGDGNTDLLNGIPDGSGSVEVRLSESGTSDRLLRVLRAEQPVATFEYGPLASVHTPAEDCGEDTVCGRTGTVVHAHTDQDGRIHDHEYAGLRYDTRHGVSLGFARHTRVTRESGDVVERRFDNRTKLERGGPVFARHAAMELIVRGGGDAPYHVELTDTSYDAIDVAPMQPHPSAEVVPSSRRTAVYEVASWQPCEEDCDISKYRLTFEDAVASGDALLLRETDTEWQYDELANLTYREAEVPGVALSRTSYQLENRASSFLLGLRRKLIHSSHSDEEGYVTRIETSKYDSRGLVTRHIQRATEGAASERTDYIFDDFGQVTRVTQSTADAPSAQVRVYYDDDHTWPNRARDPNGVEVEFITHPANGAVVLGVDPEGRSSRRVFDGFGRQVFAESPAAWVAQTFEGSGASLEVRSTGSGTPERRAVIDARGRLHQEQQAGMGRWLTTEYVYDAYGRLDRTIAPHPELDASGPVTRFEYDSLQRVTKVLADGRADLEFTYLGLRTEADDGSGMMRYTERDTAARVVLSGQVSSEGDQSIALEYGAFGQLLRQVDHAGHEWLREYDARGLLLRQVDPDSGISRFAYDGFGRLREEREDDGEVRRHYTRDAIGRPIKISERDAPGDDPHATLLEWDTAGYGQLAWIAREVDNSIVSFEYEPSTGQLVRETSEIRGEAFDTDFAYTSDGLIEKITYPEAAGQRLSVSYAHDSNGYLLEARADSVGFLWKADAYAANGEVLSEQLGNGVTTTRHLHPELGRPERLTASVDGDTLLDLDMQWNGVGQLTSRTDMRTSRTETFTYDGLGRIQSVKTDGETTGSYEYDQFGNLTQLAHQAFSAGGSVIDDWGSSLEYAAPHRLDRVDGEEVTHDARGRWTSGAGLYAEYNGFDLPTLIKRDATQLEIEYDAMGRRTWSSDGKVESIHVGRRFERTREDGKDRYTHRIEAVGGVVAELQVDSAGTIELRYIHRDHLGSTVMVTDKNGDVEERYRYTPFGERLNHNGARFGGGAVVQSGFGSHRQGDGVDLTDLGGRFYDARLGRFLSVDPLNSYAANRQSYNGYAFVMNDPMSRVDPSGFELCDGNDAECADRHLDSGPLISVARAIFDAIRQSPESGGAGRGPGQPAAGVDAPARERPPAEVVDVQQAQHNSFRLMAARDIGFLVGLAGFDDMPFDPIADSSDEAFKMAFFQGVRGGAIFGLALDTGAVAVGAIESLGGGAAGVAAAPASGGASLVLSGVAVSHGALVAAGGLAMMPGHFNALNHASEQIVRMESHGGARGGRGGGGGRGGSRVWRPGPNDVDWRGTGRGVREGLEEAFTRTGVPREQFEVTRWARDANGKSFPVEWRAPGGAEVNIDIGHVNHGPTVSHVGYQTAGRRGNGGAVRGHILLDDVPVHR